jgi:hypothetical protein
MISRRGAKAQRNDTLSVSAPLREEETFLDNYNNYFWILSLRAHDGIVAILPCIPILVDLCVKRQKGDQSNFKSHFKSRTC